MGSPETPRKKVAVETQVEKTARENGYLPEEIFQGENGAWYERATGNPIRNKNLDGIRPDEDAQYRFGR